MKTTHFLFAPCAETKGNLPVCPQDSTYDAAPLASSGKNPAC